MFPFPVYMFSNVIIIIIALIIALCWPRVDHLYSFFVQWSPDVYGREAREQGFVVVEKDELNMIDNFFSDPTACSWEVRENFSMLRLALTRGAFLLEISKDHA